MKTRYQNFVFDLYGTLVDIHAEEDAPALWRKLALYLAFKGVACDAKTLRENYWRFNEELQQESDQALRARGFDGPGEPEIRLVWRRLFDLFGYHGGPEEIEDLCRLFRALSLRRLRLFPDTMPMLNALRAAGKGVFLLSNAQSAFTRPELAYLKLDGCFDAILLSSEEGARKPSPGLYSLLQTRLGLDMADTLMTGNDHWCDCRGAADCGLDSLYIFTGGPARPTAPLPASCREIARLRDVLQYL